MDVVIKVEMKNIAPYNPAGCAGVAARTCCSSSDKTYTTNQTKKDKKQ